jgi:hypothetical protein
MRWRNEASDRGGIPEACRIQCENLWDEAIEKDSPTFDHFTSECRDGVECTHEIEVEDMSLQPANEGGPKRYIGLLNVCAYEGTELYSEGFSFECPNT